MLEESHEALGVLAACGRIGNLSMLQVGWGGGGGGRRVSLALWQEPNLQTLKRAVRPAPGPDPQNNPWASRGPRPP